MRSAEEDLALVECFEPGNFNCPIAPECELRKLLGLALNAFLEVLNNQTLADLLKPRAQLVRIFSDAARRR